MEQFKSFQKSKTVKLSQYEKVKKQIERVRERLKKPILSPKRRVLRKKRVKLPSIKSLVKKADIVFASYIRQRDGNKCVLCGSLNNPNCGHLIKRSKKTTRYSEINCNCICSGCNYKDNFDHEPYTLWFINKWGVEKYKLLYELSREFHKWTREELQEIIKKYELPST